MGVLPMVWKSFLSRTWPGAGGALIIEQMSQWTALSSQKKLAVGRCAEQAYSATQLSLLWCWQADRSGVASLAQPGHLPTIKLRLPTRSSGGSGGEER